MVQQNEKQNIFPPELTCLNTYTQDFVSIIYEVAIF